MARLLVVDDEPSARSTLALLLRRRGHHVIEADGVTTATKHLAEEVFDLVVTDLRMPDGDGLDVLRAAKDHAAATEVILLTAYAEWKSAKEAIRLGALDYFEKGQEPDELYHRIDNALAARALRRENENLRAQLRERYGLPGLIAHSPAMHTVLDLVERVAPTDATLLIQGESGTGKEVIAKAVHHASARAARPFVAVNCGAVPETLLESELFGYMRGAFTGATAGKLGLFEEADGGTLFLDEIAEIPPALQVKLLRALQSGEVRRLGATQAATIDVRVIAATHGDLAALISQGSFREDLFYRLNVIQIVLPPLRDRRETSPRWPSTSSRARPASSAASSACRRRASSGSCATRGRATCASWRMRSSAQPSSLAATLWSPTTSRRTCRRACSSVPPRRCRARSRSPTPSAPISSRRWSASAATTPARPRRSASAAPPSGGSSRNTASSDSWSHPPLFRRRGQDCRGGEGRVRGIVYGVLSSAAGAGFIAGCRSREPLKNETQKFSSRVARRLDGANRSARNPARARTAKL